MPQVPYTPVPDVQPHLASPPRLNIDAKPAAFGVNIAQAIQHLGTTEEQVGTELMNRAVAMQTLRNESEATQAIADQERQSNDLHVKFSALEGNNAVQAYPKYSQDQDDLRQKIREGLSNDESRRMYDRSSLFIMNRALFNGAGHAASENKKFANNAATSRIDSLTDAARYAIDDKDFDRIQRQIASESDFISGMAGHDDISREQFAFKNQSKALASRIIETAHKDPFKGSEMFKQAIDDKKLHSTDYDRVDRVVRSELNDTGARSISHSVMREVADPEGFLARHTIGSARVAGINPIFAERMQRAIFDFERTGGKAQIDSLYRTTEEQAEIYERHKALPGGVFAHPAAPPGTSRHERGDAADVNSAFANWLREDAGGGKTNADKYGLEFLKGGVGKRDPNHIQLSSATPERGSLPSREIPEQQVIDLARQKAEIHAPGNVDFADSAVRQTLGVYRQNRAVEEDDRRKANQTVWDEIGGDNPPATIEDLRTRSPEVNSAYERLDGKDKQAIERAIAAKGRVASDLREVQRLTGMSAHKEGIADFLDENIIDNPKLSNSDKKKFMGLQAKLSRQAEADPRVTYAMGPNGIGPIIPDDVRSDKTQMNILRGAMQDQIALYQEVYKTFPDTKALQEMGQRIMINQKREDEGHEAYRKYYQDKNWPVGMASQFWHWLTTPAGERLIELSVPTADSERIKNDPKWAEKNLPPPDENEIKRIYIGEQYDKLYGKPKKESK